MTMTAKSQDSGSVMDAMFETLLDLASSPDSSLSASKSFTGTVDDGNHIRALACACLLSFSVALADTGKLLRAATAMLMSPKNWGERILMPQILVSLQRYRGDHSGQLQPPVD